MGAAAGGVKHAATAAVQKKARTVGRADRPGLGGLAINSAGVDKPRSGYGPQFEGAGARLESQPLRPDQGLFRPKRRSRQALAVRAKIGGQALQQRRQLR